jgi:hypothetical protein
LDKVVPITILVPVLDPVRFAGLIGDSDLPQKLENDFVAVWDKVMNADSLDLARTH